MLKVNDFTNNGYTVTGLTPNSLYLLKKQVSDTKGNKYCIKVFIEEDSIEPEVWYNSKPVSTVQLQIDAKTTLQEIEEFFENIWNAIGKPYEV